MLVFGWRTAVLSLVSVQVLLLAIALIQTTRNRAANVALAALLLVVVGLLTPFTIGFAGFYDAFPWLSFAPFAVPLAVGPLVFAYTRALLVGTLPRRFAVHLAPGALQFAYQSVCFALPMTAKTWWDGRVHAPFVDPAVSVVAIGGLALYALASLRLLARYRAGLGQVVSDAHRYAARWLGRALSAVVAVLAVQCGYQAWEFAFGRLGYFDVFGLYLVLAALALYLAVEGWRHAEQVFPRLVEEPGEPVVSRAGGKDWRVLGERWAAQTRTQGWWREPDLDLATVAARLGANTHFVSRALNEGLGVNFATFVNGLRAEAVADALAQGYEGDLLALGLEAGFSSKASFNRAFKAAYGVSPSEHRRACRVSEPKSSAAQPILRRATV